MYHPEWLGLLEGRMAKSAVAQIVRSVTRRAADINLLCSMVLDAHTDPHQAKRAAWVLTHLSPPDKQEHVAPFRDALIDRALSPDLPFRPGLLLTVVYSLPEPREPRMDLLDYCLAHIADTRMHDSCRAMFIKLAARKCRPYPELAAELHAVLDLLPPGQPPSVECAKRKALHAERKANREKRGGDLREG